MTISISEKVGTSIPATLYGMSFSKPAVALALQFLQVKKQKLYQI